MIVRFKKILLSFWYFFRHKKSYSQDGEDVVLSAFFDDRKNYKGFYVDIGAHHPVRFSNTWMFYRKGWHGINVDPTPGSMRSFRFFRKKDTNLEIGIGPDASELIFYCFNEPALNTFDKKVAQSRDVGHPYRIVNTVKVPIKTLKFVLDKYLPLNQKIDFLTIDVEGLDLEVLKSNDWFKYKPEYILVEDIDFQPENPNQSEVYLFLKKKGYKIVASLKRTIIYHYIIP